MSVHRVLVTLLVIGVVLASSPGVGPATTRPRSVTVANRETRPLALPDELTPTHAMGPSLVTGYVVAPRPSPRLRIATLVPPARPPIVRRTPHGVARQASDPTH